MSTNLALAETFREIADLLDLQGERFKPEAYRRAARSLEALAEDVRKVADRGELEAIPGVGAAIAEKIRDYLRTGAVPYLERLRRELPPGLVELMRLAGIGPKTARRFWTELGVEGPSELAEAVEQGRLAGLKGFGPRKIDLVRAALAAQATSGRRMGLLPAWRIAEGIVAALRSDRSVEAVEAAGSLRRRRETVGDLDILVTSSDPERVFDAFSSLPGVTAVRLRGPTKETVEWTGGLQVDLRVVEPSAFGAALQYFTGSKDHNVHLRAVARDMGLKVNEYGVFRGEVRVASATETEVYRALGLPFIPPEIRENHGEIEAAAAGALPRLVEESDLRGVLHLHVDPDLTPEAVGRWREAARTIGLAHLGLVLATPAGTTEPPSPPEVLAAAAANGSQERAAGSPRVWIGCEVDLPRDPPGKGFADAWDFWVGRPTPGARPPEGPVPRPPLLVAHPGSDGGPTGTAADQQAAWVELARAWGAALDLAADGPVDSAGARRARDAGVALHLSSSPTPERPFDGLTLSVGLARRAWVSPTSVLNAWTDPIAPEAGRRGSRRTRPGR